MLGLQGSGKTTTSAKLAKRLTEKDRKKVLLASLDTRRPAAQEQLAVLGTQIGVTTLPIVAGQEPVAIAKRAMEMGRNEGYDVVILDTAGRLSIDEELMAEAAAVRDAVSPIESLLVVDALTGQDALTTATRFNEGIGITGVGDDALGWRSARRCRVVDACGHRQADQAGRSRRKDGSARNLPS